MWEIGDVKEPINVISFEKLDGRNVLNLCQKVRFSFIKVAFGEVENGGSTIY
jgi:hypothetical protein